MASALDIVQRAQATSLLSGYGRPNPDEQAAPYVQLGQERSPYALAAPGVAAEIKRALRALGQLSADRARTPDPAIESRWSQIQAEGDEPIWDAATADEFAIAVGRYRGWGWQVPGPYATMTPGGLQPTATGLELLAGAVHELLGGSPRMTIYEAWRAGTFDPPSRLSAPEPDAPVEPLTYFGPDYAFMPAATRPDIAEQIRAAERSLQDAWLAAMQADTEQERAVLAAQMELSRSVRQSWVDEAIAMASPRTGTTSVVQVDPSACENVGGKWDDQAGICSPPPPPPQKADVGSKWALAGVAVGVGLLVASAVRTPPARKLR